MLFIKHNISASVWHSYARVNAIRSIPKHAYRRRMAHGPTTTTNIMQTRAAESYARMLSVHLWKKHSFARVEKHCTTIYNDDTLDAFCAFICALDNMATCSPCCVVAHQKFIYKLVKCLNKNLDDKYIYYSTLWAILEEYVLNKYSYQFTP